ncbi:hypothetical protein ACFLTE_00885 [Bacteroidota bacterium]
MKNIIKYIFVLALGSVILLSCDKEPELRKPETPIQCAAYVDVSTTSSIYVDLNDPDAITLELTVNTMYDDPYQSIDLVVIFAGDYENQYVVESGITSTPHTANVTMDDLVALIPDLTSSADIVAGDAFNFFANVTLPNGTVLPAYSDEGVVRYSASVINTLNLVYNSTFFVNIPVPCAFDINNYIGTYDFHDVFYPSEDVPSSVTITEDPAVENGIIIDGLWAASCVANPVTAQFDLTTLTIIIGAQTVTDAIWGAGYMTFPDMALPLNTCSNDLALDVSFSFELWGGPYFNPILLVKN